MFKGLNSLYEKLPYITNFSIKPYSEFLHPNAEPLFNSDQLSQYGNLRFRWSELQQLPVSIRKRLYQGRVFFKEDPELCDRVVDFKEKDDISKLRQAVHNDALFVFARGRDYYMLNSAKWMSHRLRAEFDQLASDINYITNVQPADSTAEKIYKKAELAIADNLFNLGVWVPYCTLNAIARLKTQKTSKRKAKSLHLEYSMVEAIEDFNVDNLEDELIKSTAVAEITSDIFVNAIHKEDVTTTELTARLVETLKQINLTDIFEVFSEYRLREGDNSFENYIHALNVLKCANEQEGQPDNISAVLWSGATVGSIIQSVLKRHSLPSSLSFLKYSAHERFLQKTKEGAIPDLATIWASTQDTDEIKDARFEEIKATEPYYRSMFKDKDVLLCDDVLGTGRTLMVADRMVALYGAKTVCSTTVELSPHALDSNGTVEAINEEGQPQWFTSYFGLNQLTVPPTFKHLSNQKKHQQFKFIKKQWSTASDIERILASTSEQES